MNDDKKPPTPPQAAPGGPPRIQVGGKDMVPQDPAGLRFLKHINEGLAQKVSEDLPEGCGFALFLVDGGPDGYWSVTGPSTGGPSPLNAVAQWLASQGVQVGPAAPADLDEKTDAAESEVDALPGEKSPE